MSVPPVEPPLAKTHIDTHTGQHTAHDDQQQRFQITEQADRIGCDNAQFRQPRLHAGQRFLEKSSAMPEV